MSSTVRIREEKSASLNHLALTFLLFLVFNYPRNRRDVLFLYLPDLSLVPLSFCMVLYLDGQGLVLRPPFSFLLEFLVIRLHHPRTSFFCFAVVIHFKSLNFLITNGRNPQTFRSRIPSFNGFLFLLILLHYGIEHLTHDRGVSLLSHFHLAITLLLGLSLCFR